jgi:hypothetical protein
MKMMQSRKGNSFSNIYVYFGILIIFLLVVVGIQQLGDDLTTNPHANLDNRSLLYIAQINGIDVSEYNITGNEIYTSEVAVDNNTGDAIKDFSLEYFFARDKTKSLEDRMGKKTIFNMPERVLVTLMGGSKGDFQWALDIFNWFIWISVTVAVILFIRGIWTK